MSEETKSEVLVVSSKVKKHVASKHDMRCSAEVMDALTAKVEALLAEAAQKASAAKRKTIKASDLE